MLLGELLAQPRLKLAPLTGPAGADRPINRIYVTDLPDPRRYLTGGEVVLTGLMWRRGPDDSATFVAACADAGVTAIGAGDAVYGSVPADLVDACRQHGVPLFEVPVDISFRDITDQVNQALWATRASGLASVVGRQRGLVTALAAGARLADLLPAMAADLGVECWVLSPTGRVVAGTGGSPPAADLARAFLTAPRLPAAHGDFHLVGVAGRPEHRLASWCLAVTPGGDAADELANLVALERAQLDEVAQVERRLAGGLGRLLTGGADPADVRAAMLSCGLVPDATHLAVSASLTGLRSPPDLALAVLEEALRTVAPRAAAWLTGPVAVAVTPSSEPHEGRPDQDRDLGAALRSVVAALAPGLGGGHLSVGVSGPAAGAAALAGAVEEAGHAARSAAGRTAVVASGELASHELLLARVPPDARAAFRKRLLGPLLAYDEAHDADLVHTLTEFLDCGGSWAKAADRLHVHVNTLRYRISRIEALTGRDLTHFPDRVDLFLALQLP
ncbi:PucR family transcriptional regulator ligand-binding domain-containing protein [Actinomycetes bacterium KLBMP 9797]